MRRTHGTDAVSERPTSKLSPLPRDSLRLSVVMPVYNEADTVVEAIERVLGLVLPGVALDVILIESNSTDGSRDLVMKYEDDPRVKVLLEEEPRGKGHAVRTGLAEVTGDVVLIQDADLEYEVTDYPALLAAIRAGEADFVLGSRHTPGQPMREMTDDHRVVQRVVNAAHWALLALFNFTYRVRLRDPFTMYKVFRRECIDGVPFVANRFDFDWELVAKLIRLGYEPLEVPVTYNARSFSSGKKVRFFRDPPTWIWACVRFRFSRLPKQRVHSVASRKLAT